MKSGRLLDIDDVIVRKTPQEQGVSSLPLNLIR